VILWLPSLCRDEEEEEDVVLDEVVVVELLDDEGEESSPEHIAIAMQMNTSIAKNPPTDPLFFSLVLLLIMFAPCSLKYVQAISTGEDPMDLMPYLCSSG